MISKKTKSFGWSFGVTSSSVRDEFEFSQNKAVPNQRTACLQEDYQSSQTSENLSFSCTKAQLSNHSFLRNNCFCLAPLFFRRFSHLATTTNHSNRCLKWIEKNSLFLDIRGALPVGLSPQIVSSADCLLSWLHSIRWYARCAATCNLLESKLSIAITRQSVNCDPFSMIWLNRAYRVVTTE